MGSFHCPSLGVKYSADCDCRPIAESKNPNNMKRRHCTQYKDIGLDAMTACGVVFAR